MPNYFKFPFLSPFKFTPAKKLTEQGTNFDDRWAKDQIASYEMNARYMQKWQTNDVTLLQIESSSAPNNLLVLRWDWETQTLVEVDDISWSLVVAGIGYGVYELEFNGDDYSPNIYFLYQKLTIVSLTLEAISEPINIRGRWPGTKLFRYTHSINDFGVAFLATPLIYRFRCEVAIPPTSLQPKRDSNEFQDQNNQISVITGFPARIFTLFIGGTGYDQGVAPWVTDLISRIFDCDNVFIDKKKWVANIGQDIKNNPIKGRPLLTAELEIAEGVNADGLEINDLPDVDGEGGGTTNAQDLVIAYNFETDLFGPGPVVPITEIEKNS